MSLKKDLIIRPTSSPPALPPNRYSSPTSGYSKSILSAIKDIAYESMSRDVYLTQADSSSSSNALPQSPDNHLDESKSDDKPIYDSERLERREWEKSNTRNDNTALASSRQGVVTSGCLNETVVRRRERRSISCEPSTLTPELPHVSAGLSADERTQSQGAITKAIAVSTSSPRLCVSLFSHVSVQSSHSLRSVANSSSYIADERRKRSPSAASSICSKEEQSSVSQGPRILMAVCSKALFACANGQLQVLKALVKEYPELVNFQYPYCGRHSCLHIAARAGDLCIARYLLNNGANVNPKDDSWATPLHYAAQAAHLEMIKYLRDSGADGSIRDAHGKLFTSYLPSGALLDDSGTPLRFSKSHTAKREDEGLHNKSVLSQSYNSRHHYRLPGYSSFRNPISRAVRILHKK